MNKPYPLYDQRKEFSDVRALLAASAKDFGDRCVVSYRNKPHDKEKITISYIELERQVCALGTEMLARGMGDAHCVLIGKLSLSWILSYFALLSIGAVLVPLDPEWSAEDLADAAKKAQASVFICENENSEKMSEICALTGINNVIFDKSEDSETVDDLIAKGSARIDAGDNSFHNITIDPDALALLVFTSGTTGKGKGVMLSQRNILTNVYGAQKIAEIGEKMIGILPPHHTFGSTIGVLVPVYIGSEIYISHGLKYFAKELQIEKPDHLILVPLFLDTFASKIHASVKKQGKEKIFYPMLKVSNALRKLGIDITDKVFSSVLSAFGGRLKQVICGGAPMSREVYDLFTSLGLRVLNGYGITECSPLISVNRPHHIIPDSAGMPIPNTAVRIEGCGDDKEGEICVKGPGVMLGYYENEEATNEVIDADGYFHTGDIGKLDPEYGYIYITGRMKNLIILSNGKNVYPEEIESSLSAIPGVSEVVVYEGQSRRGTAHDQIAAEFYMDEEFTEKENITDAREYLAPFIEKYNKSAVVYKRVTTVKIRTEEFPKNTLRKIIRFKIDRTID